MVHKNKEMVTIKDVADLANVTAQTVSRVMRGTGYVSEETKAKVLQAAHQLNYIPSYVAKALRKGMSQSIAIVFDSLRNVYFSVIFVVRKSYNRQKAQDIAYLVLFCYYILCFCRWTKSLNLTAAFRRFFQKTGLELTTSF